MLKPCAPEGDMMVPKGALPSWGEERIEDLGLRADGQSWAALVT